MRAFNLVLLLVLVVAVAIVVWSALSSGELTLGGYPGPAQPQRIQMSPITLP